MSEASDGPGIFVQAIGTTRSIMSGAVAGGALVKGPPKRLS